MLINLKSFPADSAMAATCEAAGKKADTECEFCDYSVAGEPIDALGHKWNVVETAGPTCDAAGYTKYECANDATHTKIEEGEAATGHVDVTTEKVDATFDAAGYEKVVCACGHVVSETVIPQLVAKAYIGTVPYVSVQAAVEAVELEEGKKLGTITVEKGVVEAIDPSAAANKAFYLDGDLRGITVAEGYVMRQTTVDAYVAADTKVVAIVHQAAETQVNTSMAVTFETLAAITMKMRLPKTAVEDYTAIYAYMSVAEETKDRSYYIHTYSEGKSGSTVVYDFYLPMLAAKQMNDTITCTFYGVKADGTVDCRTRETSFVAYVSNTWPSATQTLRELLAAMLNYGTAAQTNFNYEKSTPANALLDNLTGGSDLKKTGLAAFKDIVSVQTYGTEEVPDVSTIQTRQAVGLYLEDEIRIKLTLALSNDAVKNGKDDLTLVATYTGCDDKIVKEPIVIPGTEWSDLTDAPANVAANSKMTVLYITGIAAKNTRSEVTYTVYRNYGTDKQEQVTHFQKIGIEHYITSMLGNTNSSENLKTVCKAILAYADAAAAHFN